MWCNFTKRAESCNHPGCHINHQGLYPSSFSLQTVEEEQLARLLLYQNSLLTQVAANSNQINKCLDRLIESTQNMAYVAPHTEPTEIDIENCPAEHIFQWISSGKEFLYSIQLESQISSNIYKERGFSLVVSVRDKDGQYIFTTENQKFQVFVFSMDNPPKLLKLNISGKKILRGTIEASMSEDRLITFANVVINEVTSHYVNDSFYLVVTCENSLDIKPLTISNVCVKARKPSKV
ncbi:unnamed protein product [Blepharisma stoltei]|uniref:Uncharacterized protein n=1 Tax=Blepharisma stoltei TaxID=1481888 RepID=A0AAU9KAU6_9CILI|nr:unnamed protein product [Blepharisma stoltei]